MTNVWNHILSFIALVTAFPLPKWFSEPLLGWGEFGTVVSAVVVIVGLAGEYKIEKRKERWIPDPLQHRWWNRSAFWSALIVGGIFVEFFSDTAVWRASESLQSIADHETEELHHQNLNLEAAIQPRRLNDEEIQGLAHALIGFEGRKVKISSHPNDTDAALLGAQIIRGLELAHIEPFDRRMTYQSLGTIGIGVLISGTDSQLAAAILKALPEKLGAIAGAPPSGAGTTILLPAGEDAIATGATIFIGAKPLPKP